MTHQKKVFEIFEKKTSSVEEIISISQDYDIPIVTHTRDENEIRNCIAVIEDGTTRHQEEEKANKNRIKEEITKRVSEAKQRQKSEEDHKKEKKKLNNNLKQKEDEIQSYKKENKSLSMQLKKTKKQLSSTAKEAQEFKEENSSLSDRITRIEDLLIPMRKELKETKQELRETQKNVSDLQKRAFRIDAGNLLSHFIKCCGGDHAHPYEVIKKCRSNDLEDPHKLMCEYFTVDELDAYYECIYTRRNEEAHSFASDMEEIVLKAEEMAPDFVELIQRFVEAIKKLEELH